MKLVAGLLLLMLLAGCSQPAAPWPNRDLERQDPPYIAKTLNPGWSGRLDYDLAAGQELWWDWFVEEHRDIRFGVYQHTKNGLAPIQKDDAPDGDGRYTISASGYYSLLWTNTASQEVHLMLRMPEDYWGAVYAPTEDPLASDPCTSPGGLLLAC